MMSFASILLVNQRAKLRNLFKKPHVNVNVIDKKTGHSAITRFLQMALEGKDPVAGKEGKEQDPVSREEALKCFRLLAFHPKLQINQVLLQGINLRQYAFQHFLTATDPALRSDAIECLEILLQRDKTYGFDSKVWMGVLQPLIIELFESKDKEKQAVAEAALNLFIEKIPDFLKTPDANNKTFLTYVMEKTADPQHLAKGLLWLDKLIQEYGLDIAVEDITVTLEKIEKEVAEAKSSVKPQGKISFTDDVSPQVKIMLELLLNRKSGKEIAASSIAARLKDPDLLRLLVKALIAKAIRTKAPDFYRLLSSKGKPSIPPQEFEAVIEFVDRELNAPPPSALRELLGIEISHAIGHTRETKDVGRTSNHTKVADDMNEVYESLARRSDMSDKVPSFAFKKLTELTKDKALDEKAIARIVGGRGGVAWLPTAPLRDEVMVDSGRKLTGREDEKAEDETKDPKIYDPVISPYFAAIDKNDVDEVIRLVNSGKEDANTAFNVQGKTPLIYALEKAAQDKLRGEKAPASVEIALVLLRHPQTKVWVRDEEYEQNGEQESYLPLKWFQHIYRAEPEKARYQNDSHNVIFPPAYVTLLAELMAKMQTLPEAGFAASGNDFNEFITIASRGDALVARDFLYEGEPRPYRKVLIAKGDEALIRDKSREDKSQPMPAWVSPDSITCALLRNADNMGNKSNLEGSLLVAADDPNNVLALWARQQKSLVAKEVKENKLCVELKSQKAQRLQEAKELLNDPRKEPHELIAAIQHSKAQAKAMHFNRLAYGVKYGSYTDLQTLLTKYDPNERDENGKSLLHLVLNREIYERRYPESMGVTLIAKTKKRSDFYDRLYLVLSHLKGARGLAIFFEDSGEKEKRIFLRKEENKQSGLLRKVVDRSTDKGLSKSQFFEYLIHKATKEIKTPEERVKFLAPLLSDHTAIGAYLRNWDEVRWGHDELRFFDFSLKNLEKLIPLFLQSLEQAKIVIPKEMPLALAASMLSDGLDLNTGCLAGSEQKESPSCQKLRELLDPFITRKKLPTPEEFFSQLYTVLTTKPGPENLHAFWLYREQLRAALKTKGRSKSAFIKFMLDHAKAIFDGKDPEFAKSDEKTRSRAAAQYLAPLLSRDNGLSALAFNWDKKKIKLLSSEVELTWGHLEGYVFDASDAIKYVKPVYDRYLFQCGLVKEITIPMPTEPFKVVDEPGAEEDQEVDDLPESSPSKARALLEKHMAEAKKSKEIKHDTPGKSEGSKGKVAALAAAVIAHDDGKNGKKRDDGMVARKLVASSPFIQGDTAAVSGNSQPTIQTPQATSVTQVAMQTI